MAILTAVALGLALVTGRLLQAEPLPAGTEAKATPSATVPERLARATSSPTPPALRRVPEVQAALGRLAGEVRVIPGVVDGELLGYRVFDVHPDGNVAAWGIRDHDIIVAISGTSLVGLADPVAAMNPHVNAEAWVVDLLRDDESLRLEIPRQPLRSVVPQPRVPPGARPMR